MAERRVGLLGTSGLVAECLLPLLAAAGWQVIEFSSRRSDRPDASRRPEHPVPSWICVAPIWVLPDHAGLLESNGVRRIVALSSTSRFTKDASPDADERQLALQLAEGEKWLAAWASAKGIEWVILRPTLIYGRGRDKNIAEIAAFIRRFGFFPLFGPAAGLRQPVHAEDVAAACVAALARPKGAGRAYDLSGGETLSYREMVRRVFVAMGLGPRLLSVPLWLFRIAVALLRPWPRYRHWSAAMAERMGRDLVFDHGEAARDLGFAPRPFVPAPADVGG